MSSKLTEVEEAQRRALVQELRIGPHSYWNAKTNSVLQRVWSRHRESIKCSKKEFLRKFYEIDEKDLNSADY